MFSARIAIRLPASFMLPPCQGYATSSARVASTRECTSLGAPKRGATLGASLGGDAGGQPPRRARQGRIAVARADELDAEGQAVRACMSGTLRAGMPASVHSVR